MKKAVFCVVFAVSCAAYGFSQGWFTGGNVAWEGVFSNNGDETGMNLTERTGYRFSNSLSVGMTFNYEYYEDEDTEADLVGLGLFVNYRVIEWGKLSFLPQLDVRIGGGTITDQILGAYNADFYQMGAAVSAILHYQLLPTLGIYTRLGELYFTHEWADGGGKANTAGITWFNELSFGFYAYF